MLVSEDESNPIPVLEALLNRTCFLQSHGISARCIRCCSAASMARSIAGGCPVHGRAAA